MPDFANPFSGNVPRQMTKEEPIRALRLDVAVPAATRPGRAYHCGEQEAAER